MCHCHTVHQQHLFGIARLQYPLLGLNTNAGLSLSYISSILRKILTVKSPVCSTKFSSCMCVKKMRVQRSKNEFATQLCVLLPILVNQDVMGSGKLNKYINTLQLVLWYGSSQYIYYTVANVHHNIWITFNTCNPYIAVQ